jgi:predicted HicB family RNase H-like nuclease
MSKNILKRSQERREQKKSGDDGDTADAMREALLDSEARDEDPTKRLNAEVPARLHSRFKAACQDEGKSMTTVLVQLVEMYVDLKADE